MIESLRMKSKYITTPIYYANDVPHIGHSSTTLFADIYARYYRLLGHEVLFTTGIDEHGQKVQESADKKQMGHQQYVDEMAIEWKEHLEAMNISYDYFVRTTNTTHKEVVSNLLSELYDAGDIYKKPYTGKYCVGCEEFKTERSLIDGKCEEHPNKEIVLIEEENYFFKITKYLDQVKELILNEQIKVVPGNKKNEMLARIDTIDSDLSISRPNVEWGIQIPWDKDHTVYVWVEALMNYYTNLIILNRKDLWPADVHIVGKGINWFHSVIWPSLLLALNKSLPKEVFAHSHLIVKGQKMSKTIGNVISPSNLLQQYGVDGTRYLLAATIPLNQDRDITIDFYKNKYHHALKNGIGNSFSRLTKLANNHDMELTLHSTFKETLDNYSDIKQHYENFEFNKVIEKTQDQLDELSQFINNQKPWLQDKNNAKITIEKSLKKLFIIVNLLQPILPETHTKIKTRLSGKIQHSEPIFK